MPECTPWFWNDSWKFTKILLHFCSSAPQNIQNMGVSGVAFQSLARPASPDSEGPFGNSRYCPGCWFHFISFRLDVKLMIIDVHLAIVTCDLLTDCLSPNLYPSPVVQLSKSSNAPTWCNGLGNHPLPSWWSREVWTVPDLSLWQTHGNHGVVSVETDLENDILSSWPQVSWTTILMRMLLFMCFRSMG